ncbi:MAG: YdcF family protein [Solobacterium sp.]|nr:YdcF family protein [Solobacterium sp.]
MKHLLEFKQPIWRILLLVLGITAEIFFLCNIGMQYLNLGSITGALVSLLLIGIAVRPDGFNSTIGILLRGFVLVVSILAVLTTGVMVFGVPGTAPAENSTVVILGSGVNEDGSPSLISRLRTDAVLPYILEHPDAAIVTSGGITAKDQISEAESMKQYLVEQGVPSERIHTENQSSNTEENLRFTSRLIQEHELSTTIVLVTSDFHSYRSALYAKRNRLEVSSVRAPTPWWILPTCWIREMYGVLAAWLRLQG